MRQFRHGEHSHSEWNFRCDGETEVVSFPDPNSFQPKWIGSRSPPFLRLEFHLFRVFFLRHPHPLSLSPRVCRCGRPTTARLLRGSQSLPMCFCGTSTSANVVFVGPRLHHQRWINASSRSLISQSSTGFSGQSTPILVSSFRAHNESHPLRKRMGTCHPL